MLRLQYEGSSKELSCLHDTKYTKPANTLHCVGEKLSFHVRIFSLKLAIWRLMICREIFGTSEDDAPELDHSEDSENGKLCCLDR